MIKTRLNKGIRDSLRDIVKSTTNPEIDGLRHKRDTSLRALLSHIVTLGWPNQDDMRVLEKYGFAYRWHDCTITRIDKDGEERWVKRIPIPDTIVPDMPLHHRGFENPALDDIGWELYLAYEIDKAAHEKAVSNRESAYSKLIVNCSYLEDVEKHWPGAAKVRELPMVPTNNAMVPLNEELLTFIAQDNAGMVR